MKTTPNFKMDGGKRPHPGFDAIISKHGQKGGSHPGFDAIANKAKNRSMGNYGDAKTAPAPRIRVENLASVTPSKPASAGKVALLKGAGKSALSGVGTRGAGASGAAGKLGKWS